jgi:dipeptidase E
VELHLFSTPGPGLDIQWVLEACRSVLRDKPGATVAYLPLASLFAEKWLEQTERSFKGLARIRLVNTDTTELPEIEEILRGAALLYVPGGNAFLLNHRLHVSRLLPYLRKKIQNGLPVVAFSAGAVICGPNVLTSNDLNLIPTPHFDSLGILPFNLNVHYEDSAARDEWLGEYHNFHDNPILMLEDGAYIRIEGRKTSLVRGTAWCWRVRQEKERLKSGEPIPLQ